MQALRNIFSWWNEVGLVVCLLVTIGYFGSRQIGGLFPAFALIIVLIAGLAFVVSLAMKQQVDEFGMSNRLSRLDSGIIYTIIFLAGVCLFTTIGAFI